MPPYMYLLNVLVWAYFHEQVSVFDCIFSQFEEGQVKMQSRLEEEEEAKAALMSRIQRLTKLILVSSKSTIPISLYDSETDQQSTVNEVSSLKSFSFNVEYENIMSGCTYIFKFRS